MLTHRNVSGLTTRSGHDSSICAAAAMLSLGGAVLATVFSASGGYASGQQFVDGMNPAVLLGAAVVAAGARAPFAIGHAVRAASTPTGASGYPWCTPSDEAPDVVDREPRPEPVRTLS